VGGQFTNVNGVARLHLARLLSDGSNDASFDGYKGVTGYLGGQTSVKDASEINSVLCQKDGKIVIGGWFSQVNGVAAPGIARLLNNGQVDPDFQPANENSLVNTVAVQPDGSILLAGLGSILRLTAKGAIDPTFRPPVISGYGPAFALVDSLALDPAGRILLAGYFSMTTATPLAVNGIARLTSEGAWDSTFDTGAGTDGGVKALLLEPDGQVLIGGDFTRVHDLPRTNIARLNGDPILPIESVLVAGKTVQFDVPTLTGSTYSLVYKDRLSDGDWTSLPGSAGTGSIQTFTDTNAIAPQRFYRLKIE